MKNKSKRVSTQIHTRKLDRLVAKNQMKNAGFVKLCHRGGSRNGLQSAFARDWRRFTTYGGTILV